MKRILLLFIILALLIPLFLFNINFVSNPFSENDTIRNELLNGGSSSRNMSLKADFKSPYIVSFNDDISLNEIYSSIKKYDFEILADSREKVFLIDINNIENFKKDNFSIIKNIQKDNSEQFSISEENSEISESESKNKFNVLDEFEHSSDIVIAVLDSGINRNHIALQGANILDGYDAIAQTVGINGDSLGHGTSVIGFLTAVRGNETGVDGLLKNSTIMPIKVTDENGKISSSAFIRAIYFAADSGVDIINMSFCGTAFIEAEQEAINYAYNKGCILIGASGNISEDGDLQEGDSQNFLTYPSCYEHVIGVSSINEDGVLSDFSFFNENIDIAAPGENIRVISGVTNTATIISDGTSFSAPYISALAAVVLSNLNDGVVINSDELGVLVRRNATLNNNVRCVELLDTFLDRNNPIVCGIEDGKTYFNNVIITFNHGSAYLDGSLISSGTKVNYNGKHNLVITEGNYLVQYSFITDNIPLEFECPQGDIFYKEINITFTRGTATLNGEPYYSGKPIDRSGHYLFVLTGPYGNRVEKSFTLSLDLPVVYGVEEGKIYNSDVVFEVTGDGRALLNGKDIELEKEIICSDNGSYSLELYNCNGDRMVRYNFTIQKSLIISYPIGIRNGSIFVDELYNNTLFYSSSFSGIRIYSDNIFSSIKKIISIEGSIKNIVSAGENIYCLSDSGVTVISRKNILSDNAIIYKYKSSNVTDIISDTKNVYFLIGTELYLFDTSSNSLKTFFSSKTKYNNAFYFESINSIIMYNIDSFDIVVYSLNNNKATVHTFSNKINTLLTDGEMLYSNGVIYDSDFSVHSIVNNFTPELFVNGYLISDSLLYNIQKCKIDAIMSGRISSIDITNNGYYVLYANGTIDVYYIRDSLAETLLASKAIDKSFFANFSENPFDLTIKLNDDVSIEQWLYNDIDNRIYFIGDRSNILYFIDSNFNFDGKIFLKDVPSSIIFYKNKIIVFFKTLKEVYVLSDGDGHYKSINLEFDVDMCVGNNAIYALSAGNVYRISDDFESKIFINREDIISIGYSESLKCLFASTSDGKLLKFSDNGRLLGEVEGQINDKPIICNGNNIVIGDMLFDGTTMEIVNKFDSDILGYVDSILLTKSGIYNFNNDTFTSLGSKFNSAFLVRNNIYAYTSNNEITKYSNPFDCEAGEIPEIRIDGIKDGGIYLGDVIIYFDFGYGYIDGYPFSDGDTIENGGNHKITILLPYGQIVETSFSIGTSIKSIEIIGPDKLKVNDSIKFVGKYYPLGSNDEELVFSSSSENIIITKDGLVYGVNVGNAEITCSTIDGRVSKTITVSVEPFVLVISNNRFAVDPTGNYLTDIPCYMRASELLRFIKYNSGSARIVDKNNNTVENYLSSGMWLEILNLRNEVILKYQLALIGDIDGDGYVLPNDFLLLGRHIYKSELLKGYQYEAADVTLDGNVNIADLLRISSHLLNKNRLYNNEDIHIIDDENSFIFYDIETPLCGEKFSASLYFSGPNVGVIKGKMKFDENNLSFLGFTPISDGMKVDFYEREDYIEFLVYDQKFRTNNDSTGFFFNIDFLVSDEAKVNDSTYIELFDVESEKGLTKNITHSLTIKDPQDSTLLSSIVLNNGDLEINFKKLTLKYFLSVPFNVAKIDVECSALDETAEVVVENTDLEVGSNVIRITVTKGEYSTVYEINVMRKSEEQLSSEARAKEISINAGTLSPAFSSDIYKYTITLDRDTEIGFSVNLIDEKGSYSIIKKDFGYTIQCKAENGDITEYIFEKKIIYDFSSVTPIEPVDRYWHIVIILISVALVGIITTLILINRNKKVK